MNHTIIPFSKKKMVKLTGIYILIMLGIAAIIFFILSADRISLYYLALFVVLFIAGAYLFYKHIQELWSSNKKNEGVILTSEYLKSNVTPLGKKVGEIPWSEIASIEKVNYYGQHIHIKLKQPEKYANRLKGMGKDFTGIYLNDSELEITFEELEKIINEYFSKYSNS
jgi:hypothetical protein